MPRIVPIDARALRIAVALSLGLALAACDKCSFPTWQPNKPAGPPLSCHDDPPAR